MSDDLNSNQPADVSSGNSSDELARAFENLVAQVPSSAGVHPTFAGKLSLPDSGPCPEPGDWLRLADGETSATESEALLSHAARCAECVVRMRQGYRVLSRDASPEESAELDQFASSSPRWRHRLGVELANTPHLAARKSAPRLLLWASAGLATAFALVVGFVAWERFENDPAKLQETHLRGGATDHEPSQLLTARAEIERKLEGTPAAPHWLQLEARADLLEEKYDPAIDILDRLLAAGPVTPELLTDDASAYFQRGTAAGSENDRATALDELRRADCSMKPSSWKTEAR
jgi:tetratricopeptide (TPR) repeat protein